MANNTVRGRMQGESLPVDTAAPVAVKELPLDPDKALELSLAAPTALAVAPVAEVVAPTAVVAPIVAPVELPELRYEYQPTDEQGRTLGGLQVIKYRTPEELATKLSNQNIELVRKLREVTRKQRLGIDDSPTQTTDGKDVELFNNAYNLEEKTLSPEEVFNLTQDMNDPAKFVDARDRLLESAIGCNPQQLRERFNQQQQVMLQLLVKSNYDSFESRNRDTFYPCPENKQLLTDLMTKKGYAPTVTNFNLALNTLREAGLLLEAPTVREVTPAPTPAPAPVAAPAPAPVSTEPNPQAPVPDAGRIATTSTPQEKRQPVRVPSGLNERTSSNSGPTSVRTSLTIAEFDAIPSDELKKRLKDPSFAKTVNELFEKKPAQA